MCVLALAWQAHPHWRLILAGNRDEFHARPSAALARWEEPAHLIAGRDLEAGGTWLGVSDLGRLAVVTNRRDYPRATGSHASRGALVTDMLSHDPAGDDAAIADPSRFNPFNLIVATQHEARFLTNAPDAAQTALTPGVYGLSNGALNEPWPKTRQLKAALADWIEDEAAAPQSLFNILVETNLSDSPEANGNSMPDTASDRSPEPNLSPIFIRNPIYGTRCSTVVAIDMAGNGQIIERRFTPHGETTGETSLRFHWPSP